MRQVLKMYYIRMEMIEQPQERSIAKGIVVREAQRGRGLHVIVDYLYDLKAVQALFTNREFYCPGILYPGQDGHLMPALAQSLGEIERHQLGSGRFAGGKPVH